MGSKRLPADSRLYRYDSSMTCALCRAQSDAYRVFSDREAVVLVDNSPLTRGHLLVASTQHVSSVADLDLGSRRGLLRSLNLACQMAKDIAGRNVLAVEHGRSPTCGDASCSCHAHVHVIPVGSMHSDFLSTWDAVEPTDQPGSGPHIAIYSHGGTRYATMRRYVPHAARSIGAMIATENGVPWSPMGIGATESLASSSATGARRWIRKHMSRRVESNRSEQPTTSGPSRPSVFVAGPTGAGKSTVGAQLAAAFGVQAVELGVLLRLACLQMQPISDAQLASGLWRWIKRGRVDFSGTSTHALAASIPRLDGAYDEQSLWSEIDPARLADSARGRHTQEVLDAIVNLVAQRDGAVVVGRIPPELSSFDGFAIELTASPKARAQRKRRQLHGAGLLSENHDWFVPASERTEGPVLNRVISIDTTNVQPSLIVNNLLESMLPSVNSVARSA